MAPLMAHEEEHFYIKAEGLDLPRRLKACRMAEYG